MADPFYGEIRFFSFTYPPIDWAQCLGQQLTIQQYTTLYAVIGYSFGGNNNTVFNLPNLQGSTALGAGTGTGLTARVFAAAVGTEAVTLNTSGLASHNHTLNAGTPLTSSELLTLVATPAATTVLSRGRNPSGTGTNVFLYSNDFNDLEPMNANTVGPAGSGGPHENRQPYLAMNACICLLGEWPPHP